MLALDKTGALGGTMPYKSISYTDTCMLRFTPIPGPDKNSSLELMCVVKLLMAQSRPIGKREDDAEKLASAPAAPKVALVVQSVMQE